MVGKLSIRFATTGLQPINQAYIIDDSAETCSATQTTDNAFLLQHTQLRCMRFAGQIGDSTVTITGVGLGCGYNLYVSALSLEHSTSWLGRWPTCQLLDTSYYGNKQSCSYSCTYPGYWKEIQILKFPHSSDEYIWEICHINVTADFPGKYSDK